MITKDFVKLYYQFLLDGFKPSPHLKRQIRYDSQRGYDPLAKSLREESRFLYRHDGESMYEYGLAKWLDWTDDDIQRAVRDMERHSVYDCSGKMCTRWISWKRTPAGVAIVHAMVLDV